MQLQLRKKKLLSSKVYKKIETVIYKRDNIDTYIRDPRNSRSRGSAIFTIFRDFVKSPRFFRGYDIIDVFTGYFHKISVSIRKLAVPG